MRLSKILVVGLLVLAVNANHPNTFFAFLSGPNAHAQTVVPALLQNSWKPSPGVPYRVWKVESTTDPVYGPLLANPKYAVIFTLQYNYLVHQILCLDASGTWKDCTGQPEPYKIYQFIKTLILNDRNIQEVLWTTPFRDFGLAGLVPSSCRYDCPQPPSFRMKAFFLTDNPAPIIAAPVVAAPTSTDTTTTTTADDTTTSDSG